MRPFGAGWRGWLAGLRPLAAGWRDWLAGLRPGNCAAGLNAARVRPTGIGWGSLLAQARAALKQEPLWREACGGGCGCVRFTWLRVVC
jgi:hypothetical protein